MPRNIVRGQTVNPEQITGAGELRKHQTPEEKILWEELRGSRLGVHCRRQQLSAGDVADFYCHSAALVVELDGIGPQQQPGYHRLRDEVFAKLGIRTLRFSNQQVRKERGRLVAQIRAALT
jgi:very-short-patch-repair endonuclease